MFRKSVTARLSIAAVAATAAVFTADAGAATWEPFIIRTNPSATTPLTITDVAGVVTTNIDESGEKTGYGTDDFNGQTVGSLEQVNYTRLDAGTKDPYLNVWITDGSNYAVISPVANMTGTGDYTNNDVAGLDLSTLGFNIYETSFANLNWVFPGATRVKSALIKSDGTPVTLADIAALTLEDPGIYPNPPVGTGAPKNGSAVNIIFGDTQGNFVSPVPYSISNVSAVPEPASLGLLGVAATALLGRRRRKTA